jgi:hypothetical protein
MELEGLQGNDLLFRLFEASAALTQDIAAWQTTAQQVALRSPAFQTAAQLLLHAVNAALPGMDKRQADLDAVRDQRSLLDDPDPVAPVLQAVATALRTALREAHTHYGQVLEHERAALAAQPLWSALPVSQQQALLTAQGVTDYPAPELATEAALLAALQACDLAGWQTRTAALPTRFAAALAKAIQAAQPKARRVSLPSATIATEAELDAWLDAVRASIQQALVDGPAIV